MKLCTLSAVHSGQNAILKVKPFDFCNVLERKLKVSN